MSKLTKLSSLPAVPTSRVYSWLVVSNGDCRSMYNQIQETPCQHPVVFFRDINYGDLESLVQYMYSGEVFIKMDQLGRFLKTAEALQVKGLAENPNISSRPGTSYADKSMHEVCTKFHS